MAMFVELPWIPSEETEKHDNLQSGEEIEMKASPSALASSLKINFNVI